MAEQLANAFANPTTTLASAATAGDLTLTVAAAFLSSPQTGNLRANIEDEIVKVTAGADGTSWTVTRGQEGTTAVAHASGVAVNIVATAASIAAAITDQLAAYQSLDTDLTEIAAVANVRGDLLVTDATPSWVRLGLGTSGQFLKAGATDPAWATLAKADLPAAIAYEDEANTFTGTQIMGGAAITSLSVTTITADSVILNDPGQFTASDGTALAPAYSFSDLASGMYRVPGVTDVVGFASNGVARLLLDGNGATLVGNRLNSSNGVQSLSLIATASGVNYLQIRPGASTTEAFLEAAGTATNLDIRFVPKGTGGLTINGQQARTLKSLRHTTANTAGNALTIQSGGATLLATDKAAGNLTLATGISTGTGSGSVIIQTPTPGSTGTADNALATRATFNSVGLTIVGTLIVGTQQTYAASNVTTDRTYDANATTIDELSDVVGTLIADLRTIGLVL